VAVQVGPAGRIRGHRRLPGRRVLSRRTFPCTRPPSVKGRPTWCDRGVKRPGDDDEARPTSGAPSR
jgi:hypothetical protein